MPTRILITGSRSWHCLPIALRIMRRLRDRYGDELVVVHGDCPTGVDRSFRLACEELGVKDERHPADWSVGKKGGPERNERMVSLGATFCLAVHQAIAWSKGTRDCASKAMTAGIPVYLCDGQGAIRRLRREDLER